MSVQSNIAVEHEMKKLLDLIKANADWPPEELLALVRKHVEETLAAAKSGWL